MEIKFVYDTFNSTNFIFQIGIYIVFVILMSGEAQKLSRSKANLFKNLQEVIE